MNGSSLLPFRFGGLLAPSGSILAIYRTGGMQVYKGGGMQAYQEGGMQAYQGGGMITNSGASAESSGALNMAG